MYVFMSTENVEHVWGKGLKPAEGRMRKDRRRHVHGGALSLVEGMVPDVGQAMLCMVQRSYSLR